MHGLRAESFYPAPLTGEDIVPSIAGNTSLTSPKYDRPRPRDLPFGSFLPLSMYSFPPCLKNTFPYSHSLFKNSLCPSPYLPRLAPRPIPPQKEYRGAAAHYIVQLFARSRFSGTENIALGSLASHTNGAMQLGSRI
jgi:hypothetical protein